MARNITDLINYKRLQGQRAQANGALFERLFENRCRRVGIAITRFPDGCKQLGPRRLIRIKTPFDWICTYQGKTALLDTKTSTNSFPHSQISDHQIHELVHQQIAGAIAGYVIWVRKMDRILFVSSTRLEKLAKERGSINYGQEHIQSLGDAVSFDPRLLFMKDPNGY